MGLRPLRNLVLVERILDPGQTRDAQGFVVTSGGIALPQDYKAIGSRKAVNRPDHFRARVIAVGPKVTDPLIVPGAEVPILSWSTEPDGTRRGLYTGVDVTKDELFVRWPDDFGGVVMNVPDAFDGMRDVVREALAAE
jgi:hypothetical protein